MIYVLFDGQCGLCRKSVHILNVLDWFGYLEFVDMHDEAQRLKAAPDITFADLNKAMHIRTSGGKTYKGFAAFRRMTWSLPLLWIFAPFLYIPGVNIAGDAVYTRIAEKRNRCTHESCGM